MEERVYFVDEALVREQVAAALKSHSQFIRNLLPFTVAINHVGSTAVPGALTKGDLDLLLQVFPDDFPAAEAALAEHYARNEGSLHTAGFASFNRDEADPPLGIQLTCDNEMAGEFLSLLQLLQQSHALLDEYNQLKRDYDGFRMDEYRQCKAAFIERVLAGARKAEDSPRP